VIVISWCEVIMCNCLCYSNIKRERGNYLYSRNECTRATEAYAKCVICVSVRNIGMFSNRCLFLTYVIIMLHGAGMENQIFQKKPVHSDICNDVRRRKLKTAMHIYSLCTGLMLKFSKLV
jgi:hypothetical protein